jgi:hypothetical protein
VAAGLKWIIRHQAQDGHWGLHDFQKHGKCNCTGVGGNHDVAGTAFGLLPLLGMGAGKEQLYSDNVERGVKWLIARAAGRKAEKKSAAANATALATVLFFITASSY